MMASMDSQFIANLISGISALATVVAAIYTRRQAIGSKEAKAKAEESHKAALDMRDAAQRSQRLQKNRLTRLSWRVKLQRNESDRLRSYSNRCSRLSLNSRASPSHSPRLRLTYGALNFS